MNRGRLNLFGRILVVTLVLGLGEVAYLAIDAWGAQAIDMRSLTILLVYALALVGGIVGVLSGRDFHRQAPDVDGRSAGHGS